MNGTVRMTAARRMTVRWLAVLVAIGLQIAGYGGRLHAQVIDTNQFINHFPLPDTPAPWRPVWGFNDDEYSVGAYMQTDPPIAPNWTRGGEWQLARSLGVKIIEERSFYEGVSAHGEYLADSAVGRDSTGRWNERVIVVTDPLQTPGWGREAILYPFDSAQWYYWPCMFRTKSGGFADSNSTQRDHQGHRSREQVYDTSNTSPNEQILSRIAFGYDSIQFRRYSPSYYWDDPANDSTEVSGDAFWVANDLDMTSRWSTKEHPAKSHHLWFVVTGHLFEPLDGGGTAADTDSLLTLEVWLEVSRFRHWTDSAWADSIHGVDHFDPDSTHEILYATRYVRKADLYPTGTPIDFNAYREVAFPIDMIRDSVNGLRGPWFDDGVDDRTHRFDLRVRWTGREKLALRSVAIRDTAMQLLMSSTAQGIAFRDTLTAAADRIMFGVGAHNADTLARRMGKIIRLGLGDENPPLRWAGFSYLDSMLYRRYPSSRPADSLVKGTRGWHGMADLSYNRCVNTSENEIPVETYLFDRTDTNTIVDFGLPKHLLTFPALPEHNGGRFGGGRWDTAVGKSVGIVPLTIDPSLPHSRDSIENYTKMIQRMQYGEYYHGPIHGQRGGVTVLLGNAAAMSRRAGRRIIHWPGNHIHFDITWKNVKPGQIIQDSASLFTDGTGQQWAKDIPFPRLPEASELRAMVNLGICYGARGIHWPFIGCNDLTLQEDAVAFTDAAGHRHYNWGTDWGDIGPRFADSNDYKRLSDSLFIFYNFDSTQHDTIRHLYTGWNTRLRTIRWINRVWLASIGPEMLKLRWRDGYSMHFTVPQTYPTYIGQPHVRPFPTNEVVRSIEAWDRWGHKDSAGVTYVELGLFDKKTGTTGGVYDPMKDTTHIYLVNRRTFERPDAVSDTSARGKFLDSLAETRTLIVSLHIPHPDTTQYNFVHVREIVPDTSRLPGMNAPRAGLDTVVNGDSAIALTLRPGGGALLRITYTPPDISADAGDLQLNGQHKYVYLGNRYFATYHRWAPIGVGWSPCVFLRRSLPVTATTGAILWEPVEYNLNLESTSDYLFNNYYPALTARIAGSDTVISVVWTATYNDTTRQVLFRNIRFKDSLYPDFGPIEHVSHHRGVDPAEWGTAVISHLNGGDAIVWSDSLLGVMAKVRLSGDTHASNWWWVTPGYSDSIMISHAAHPVGCPLAVGRHPSVPAFAHVNGLDSNCGVVWEQPLCPTSSDIYYLRLVHDSVKAVRTTNLTNISEDGPGRDDRHPCIDQIQDVFWDVYEGVAWESIDGKLTILNFRTLNTATTSRLASNGWHQWDSIEQTYKWNWAQYIQHKGTPVYHIYPNTAALNERYAVPDTANRMFFSLTYDCDPSGDTNMYQAMIEYAVSNYLFEILGSDPLYSWSGRHPQASVSPYKQQRYAAALYQTQDMVGDTIMRTSRQFFARQRPVGYLARGRDVVFRIDDSVQTGMRVTMHDVWVAGPAAERGVAPVPLPAPQIKIDSMEQVKALLRTEGFPAYDSTVIGCTLRGTFYGDSTIADGRWIDFVAELVDSSTGTIVAVLDSFRISAENARYDVDLKRTLDLTTGWYYIRLRPSSPSYPALKVDSSSRYPIAEVCSQVESEHEFARLRRIDESAAELTRLTAQPNPFNAGTEIRFTVSRERKMTLRVLDDVGREVARPVDGVWTVPGRYAIDLDGRGLRAGTYLVDLDEGGEHTLTKVVLIR